MKSPVVGYTKLDGVWWMSWEGMSHREGPHGITVKSAILIAWLELRSFDSR